MDTQRKKNRYTASLLAAALAWCLSAQATPPIPPAEFISPKQEQLARVEPRDGFLYIPIEFRASEEIDRISVSWHVIDAMTLEADVLERGRQRLEQKEQRSGSSLVVEVPVMQSDGRYLIEFELTGRKERKQALFDRLRVYQIVENGKARLVTPIELRREDQARRNEAFRKKLQAQPDHPDVRLLSADTVQVPEDIVRTAAPADRQQVLVKGTGPGRSIRPYVKDKTRESWSARDPITVRGRVMYLDFEGTWRPLVNVSVNLFDSDTFGDDHLGTTVTDWNGDWSFTVNNNDGFLQNGRDVYYRFHLGNTRWRVRDDDANDYVWQSAVRSNVSEGSIVDFGSQTGITDRESMQIFAMINRGWNHIVNAGGQDPGHVELKYPGNGSFWMSSTETITIDTAHNTGPDIVLHEYGHALMYYAFGGEPLPTGSHTFGDDLQDRDLAYSEGWATGFMLSVCPDQIFDWTEGTTEGPGEWPACTTQNDTGGQQLEQFSDAGNRVGERNEGRVAAAINDFRDFPNDNNGGSEDRGRDGESDANSSNRMSLATIYRDSMWGYVHEDFLEFWITLAGNLSSSSLPLAGDVMQYNWMSLPLSLSCVASKVVTAEQENADGLLDGLRAFRDHGLKPLKAGRQWIQVYYRHSPELAILLIKDTDARRAAMNVINHFSALGHAFTDHDRLSAMVYEQVQVVPEDVSKSINQILKTIEKDGSRELVAELVEVRRSVASMSGLTLGQAIRRAEEMAPAEKGSNMAVVRPADLSPASRKVDWGLIREYLGRAGLSL